ncbi:hypothetical protein AB2L57_01730 [Microbacterium sp. HA-8]|nr:hypothetical protein [Microbacterium sp. BR1]
MTDTVSGGKDGEEGTIKIFTETVVEHAQEPDPLTDLRASE